MLSMVVVIVNRVAKLNWTESWSVVYAAMSNGDYVCFNQDVLRSELKPILQFDEENELL